MKIIDKSAAKSLSPLTLAFYGDSVYEVLVRQKIVLNGSLPASKLHKAAVERVRASYQSMAYDLVETMLNEDEADIMRRGRNANGNHIPKSSNPRDYRGATGIEALFGYLHLIGEKERMEELFEVIYRAGTEQPKSAGTSSDEAR